MFYTVILNDAQAIFAYETLNAATEKFHNELYYALNQNNACTCMVIDKDGAVYRSEKVYPQVVEEIEQPTEEE